jgi:hypothetical protein
MKKDGTKKWITNCNKCIWLDEERQCCCRNDIETKCLAYKTQLTHQFGRMTKARRKELSKKKHFWNKSWGGH